MSAKEENSSLDENEKKNFTNKLSNDFCGEKNSSNENVEIQLDEKQVKCENNDNSVDHNHRNVTDENSVQNSGLKDKIKQESCDTDDQELKEKIMINDSCDVENEKAITETFDNKEEKSINDQVENDPNFAVICSFLDRFGKLLDLPFSIHTLKTLFEDNSRVRPDLIDLHIKLMRKRRKYINKEKWETALQRFCLEYSHLDAWELERFGYKNASLSLRLRVFLRLLEAMFDYNPKFKSELSTSNEPNDLRIPAFGRDMTGFTYWYQVDSDLNFRLYKDEPDEEGSWSLVSKNLEELNECIEYLKNISIETLKSTSTSECNSNPQSVASAESRTLIGENDLQHQSFIKNEFTQDSIMEEEIKDTSITHAETEIESTEHPSNETLEFSQSHSIEIERSKSDVYNIENDFLKPSISCVREIDDSKQLDSSIDEEVKSIYQSLIDDLEKDEEDSDIEAENSSKINNKQSSKRVKRKKRRGRKWTRAKTDANKHISSNQKQKEENHEKEKPGDENKITQETSTIEDDAAEKDAKNKPNLVRNRKRRSEIEKLKEDFAEELTTTRFSRRIQALQEKKMIQMQEEQKRLEKEMEEKRRKKEAAMTAKALSLLICDKSNDSSDNRKHKRRRKKNESDDDYQKDSDDEENDVQINEKKKKKRRRGKGKRKGANPWEDSDDSDDEAEKTHHIFDEEEYDYDEEENEELKFDDNDEDEFACEEIDPNAEPVIVRRARTVKKSKEENDFDLESFVNDDKPCGKCGKFDNPQWILLCDKCDEGFHTSCLRPPLFLIPSGEWFCPPCEHKLLIEKLSQESERLSKEIEKRLFEKQKQQKRWRGVHCEISKDNIVEGQRDSTQKCFIDQDDYLDEDEFDGEEQEEIENDSTAKQSKSYNRQHSKRKRRKPNGWLKDEIEELLDESNDSEDFGLDNESEISDEDETRALSQSSSADEIGKRAFSDDDDDLDEEERRQRRRYDKIVKNRLHKKMKRKEKKIDINDYSRSGLKLRSARKRKPISYLFKEYDDLIKSAIYEEDDGEYDEEEEDKPGMPRSKGKDINNILMAASTEMPDFSINPFETKKEPNDQNVGTHSTTLDNSMVDESQKTKSGSKKRRRAFFVDSDESEEEDDDLTSEEELSDSNSDESSDYAPRTRRAASKKRFSYREDSSTDQDDYFDDTEDKDLNLEKKESSKNSKEKNLINAYSNKVKLDNPQLKSSLMTYGRDKQNKNEVENDDGGDDLQHKKLKLSNETSISNSDSVIVPETHEQVHQNSSNKTTIESESTVTDKPKTEPTVLPTSESKEISSNSDKTNKNATKSVKRIEYQKDVSFLQAPPASQPIMQVHSVLPQFPPTSSNSGHSFDAQPYHQSPSQNNVHVPSAPQQAPPLYHDQPRPLVTNYSTNHPPPPPYLNRQPVPTIPPPGPYHVAPPPRQFDPTSSSSGPQNLYQSANMCPVQSQPMQQHCYPPSFQPSRPPSVSKPVTKSSEPEGYTLMNLDSFKSSPSIASYQLPPSYSPGYHDANSNNNSPPQILNLDSGKNSFSNFSLRPNAKPSSSSSDNSQFYPDPTRYDNVVKTPPQSNYYVPPPSSANNPGYYPPRLSPPTGVHLQHHVSPHHAPNATPQSSHPPNPPHYTHHLPVFRSSHPSPQAQSSNRLVFPPTSTPVVTSNSSPVRPPSNLQYPLPPVDPYNHPSHQPYFYPPAISNQNPYPSPVLPSHNQYPVSNGGFMIQNILLNRPPNAAAPVSAPKQIRAVKSAPKSLKTNSTANLKTASPIIPVTKSKKVKGKNELTEQLSNVEAIAVPKAKKSVTKKKQQQPVSAPQPMP
ncbi:Membrane metallo-endopeptidase-like 1 [Sarcoptes scabiei]|nr:Membrane metallo-endopeptidase-like 1 [Sarcoptes scabiei]